MSTLRKDNTIQMGELFQRHPIAASYLKTNSSFSEPTPDTDRGEGVFSSITVQVYPESGGMPDLRTVVAVYELFQEFGEKCSVEESIVQFVVNDDNGEQIVVRNVKMKGLL